MPKNEKIKSVLVIGSGPIVIGSAAEFDYAGVQACLALKEEGVKVILINSNPATIMTDKNIADVIYIEPLEFEFVLKIIKKHRPDALLANLGGQTGLNLAMQLNEAGVLKRYGVELLGTSCDSIDKAESRERFKSFMQELNEPVPDSIIAKSTDQALEFAKQIGYPLIIRPAFTMGGSGGGTAYNDEELIKITQEGLINSISNECLIEKSIIGYKELEFEVIRDKKDQAILVCDMQNIDAVGIHTGDSAVIAPAMYISNEARLKMQQVALKLIKAFKIEGGCNVQIALDENEQNYYVIELNPRVSRSSALASKASTFAIAKISAKIALGYTLDELHNELSGLSYLEFRPKLDYVVSKLPRFAFDKLSSLNCKLGTQMKSTGEVMGLGTSFNESMFKALRSLEYKNFIFDQTLTKEQIADKLQNADDERIFYLYKALYDGFSVDEVAKLSLIDVSFIKEFAKQIELINKLKNQPLNYELLKQAKEQGLSDELIAGFSKLSFDEVRAMRLANNLRPGFASAGPMDDAKKLNYFYSSYLKPRTKAPEACNSKKILILGSGPIRIAQGIEFDYSSVHAVWAIKELGYEAIIVNNNPETLSTDYTVADKLYFEPLELESLLEIIDYEQIDAVIISFGGQGAIDLAFKLAKYDVKILGTSLDNINKAEDRREFEALNASLNIAQPKAASANELDQALNLAKQIGYPVLARPSFVLGGRAMAILYNDEQLKDYWSTYSHIAKPVLIDKYLNGKEIEVDAIYDGQDILIASILEHIEQAGVHSGDSILISPSINLSDEVKSQIKQLSLQLAKALEIRGLLNIQFVLYEGVIYVLELNPRASRTLPFLSKITGLNLASIATKVMCGLSLKQLGIDFSYVQNQDFYAVKAPVFSFAKLALKDDRLSPQMKSTGEVMSSDENLNKALYKALLASGVKIEEYKKILFSISNEAKPEAAKLAKRFSKLDYELVATAGTAKYFNDQGIACTSIAEPNRKAEILKLLDSNELTLVINISSASNTSKQDSSQIRYRANACKIACFTNLDTASALLNALETVSVQIKQL